jgi:hypothetical protein
LADFILQSRRQDLLVDGPAWGMPNVEPTDAFIEPVLLCGGNFVRETRNQKDRDARL